MVDRVSVALAMIGSSNAPICNLEPLCKNTLIERDLSDGAVLVISSQSMRSGRYVEQQQHRRYHQSEPQLQHVAVVGHHPRTKSPQTTMRMLEAEAERKRELEKQEQKFGQEELNNLFYVGKLNNSSWRGHRGQQGGRSAKEEEVKPSPSPSSHLELPNQAVANPPPRHSHRRSLSTSDHLHFAGKNGPPTLSAAAFEPDEHLLSTTDSNSSSPKSISHDDEEEEDVHSVNTSSSSSSGSNASVIKTEVYDETAEDFNDTPKSVIRVPITPTTAAALDEEEGVDFIYPPPIPTATTVSVQEEETPKSLPRTPSLNAAAMILKRRHSFTTSSTLSPRPRLGSAPEVDSIADKMGGNEEDDDDDNQHFPIRKSTSKDSITSGETTHSNSSTSRRSRTSHRRHHSRQLSQPTLAGGGVEIEMGATNTSNEAEANAKDKTDLVLPDGLVVTYQGITASPSPSNEPRRRGNFKLDVSHHSSHSPSKLSQPTPRLLAPGQFNPQDLETLGLIGKGTAGVVTKALHVSALRIVAVKSVQKFDFTKRETTIAEIRALHRKMVPFLESDWAENPEDSSCIVGFYDAYIPKDGASVNLVLEWMDGGSLQDLVDRKKQAGGKLSEEFIAVACRRILKGLVELQESRLLHVSFLYLQVFSSNTNSLQKKRDLKPANVLVSRSGAIKLSDFGVSIAFGLGDLSNAQTYIGSLSYMAPERVNASKHGENGGYSYASDLWAVGLIAYVCATGDYPFKKQFDDEGFWGLYQAVEEEIPPLSEDIFSKPLVEFISKCLQKDPTLRPTAQDLLEHDEFVQNLPNAREIVAGQFDSVDQTKAREELFHLLDIVCESHHQQYKASLKCGSDSSEVYSPPTFTLNRFRVLCTQLNVEFDSQSDEEDEILELLNGRLQQVCGGGGGEELEEEVRTPKQQQVGEEEEKAFPAAVWKKKHLTLQLQ